MGLYISAIIYIDLQRAIRFRQNLIKCCIKYEQISESLVAENIEKITVKKLHSREN